MLQLRVNMAGFLKLFGHSDPPPSEEPRAIIYLINQEKILLAT